LAHALGTASEYEFTGPGLDLHGREDHSLQSRAAAPVELEASRCDGQTGIESSYPADCGCLAVRIALAQDHVIN
jgi:hypothetical protein